MNDKSKDTGREIAKALADVFGFTDVQIISKEAGTLSETPKSQGAAPMFEKTDRPQRTDAERIAWLLEKDLREGFATLPTLDYCKHFASGEYRWEFTYADPDDDGEFLDIECGAPGQPLDLDYKGPDKGAVIRGIIDAAMDRWERGDGGTR